jgi:ribonuclease D
MELLEDEHLLKVGLSIKDDFMNLNKLKELHPEGFVDLQSYVKQFGIADNSLQRIYGILFGERISKGQRLTNWEAEQLSEAQMQYAALDALACIKIYDYLSAGNFNPNTSEYLRPIIVEDEGEII